MIVKLAFRSERHDVEVALFSPEVIPEGDMVELITAFEVDTMMASTEEVVQ